jgi:hypothetical protein
MYAVTPELLHLIFMTTIVMQIVTSVVKQEKQLHTFILLLVMQIVMYVVLPELPQITFILTKSIQLVMFVMQPEFHLILSMFTAMHVMTLVTYVTQSVQ